MCLCRKSMLFCNIVDLSILRVLPGNMVPSSLMRTLNWSLRFFSDLLRDTLWVKTCEFSYQCCHVVATVAQRSPDPRYSVSCFLVPKCYKNSFAISLEALKMWGFTVWPCPSHLLPLTRQSCCRHPCREKTKSTEEPKTFIRSQILIHAPMAVHYCLK